MKKPQFQFTIFIPTFNRAHTLPRALNSVANQTFRDFEVVIIDDGSTDGTPDLVKSWQKDSDFPIAYHWQPNQGKHAAHNKALQFARGFLMVTLDSDDMLVSNTLERFKHHWDNIAEKERKNYAGIVGLGAHLNDGRISGDRFPKDVYDSNWLDISNVLGIRGDKKDAIRLDLLRKYPFPQFEGERHMRLSLLCQRLSHDFKFRFVNEVVQIFEQLPDGISSDRFSLRTGNPRGFHYYYREAVNIHDTVERPKTFLRNHVQYIRYGLLAGIGVSRLFLESQHRFFFLLTLPMGVSKWMTDRLRLIFRGKIPRRS